MTKAEEKALLCELAAHDTYFIDTFSQKDVDCMLTNIDNDHPILLGTGWVKFTPKNIEIIKKTLKNRIEVLSDAIEIAEQDPNSDTASIMLMKEECADLIFAENKFKI